MFPELSLPPYSDIKLRTDENGRTKVFDILRRRYVTLTPEEWVRQHFVNYLTQHLDYPAALMANEVELRVGEKKLRCDSVLFSTDKTPRMIVEYKAPNVQITTKVLQQIAAYNVLLGVDYLIMSNGIDHVTLHYDHAFRKWEYLMAPPYYSDLVEYSPDAEIDQE